MPMQYNLYPDDWPEIALALKVAASWTCQRCGACRGDMQVNRHGLRVAVQIGVAHLDHDPWNRSARLEVMCRMCHLIYDGKDRRRKRVMMAIARGQMVLPGLRGLYQAPRQYPRTFARVHQSKGTLRRSQRAKGVQMKT